MPLRDFAFVLFKPKSPGNIGAAARALKNMGCHDLRIVQPGAPYSAAYAERTQLGRRFGFDDAATMAVHGRDILDDAPIHADLSSALADRTIVVGTTARAGFYRNEAKSIREVAVELGSLSDVNRIAVVFGPEDCGLTNQELKLCQRLITIPTAPEYPSLNLAQAVMITAYELMLAAGAPRQLPSAQQWAPIPEMEAMLARMTKALVAIGFLPEDNPDHIMFALRAVLGRAGLKPRELHIINGIASQILWYAQSGYDTLARKRAEGKKIK